MELDVELFFFSNKARGQMVVYSMQFEWLLVNRSVEF